MIPAAFLALLMDFPLSGSRWPALFSEVSMQRGSLGGLPEKENENASRKKMKKIFSQVDAP